MEQQRYPAVNPRNYDTNLPGEVCPLDYNGMTVTEVTNISLIGFEVHVSTPCYKSQSKAHGTGSVADTRGNSIWFFN